MSALDDARIEAERRWPIPERTSRESGANAARVGRQDAFLAGVEWAQQRTDASNG